MEKSGQGERRGLGISGHPFQCGLCEKKRRDRIERDGNISSIEVSIRQRQRHLNFMKSDIVQNLVSL